MYLAKKEDNYSWLDYCSACALQAAEGSAFRAREIAEWS